jgi:hypothetical protein
MRCLGRKEKCTRSSGRKIQCKQLFDMNYSTFFDAKIGEDENNRDYNISLYEVHCLLGCFAQ